MDKEKLIQLAKANIYAREVLIRIVTAERANTLGMIDCIPVQSE